MSSSDLATLLVKILHFLVKSEELGIIVNTLGPEQNGQNAKNKCDKKFPARP